jgi:hypothetical protein
MKESNLEAVIRELQDIEEIKNLHARYASLIELNRWDDVVDLFSENAIGDWGTSRGRYQGKEQLAAFFKKRGSRKSTLLGHMMIQPEIEVHGDQAFAKWQLLGMGTYTLPQGETAVWTHGKYDNQLVRENGKWKISHLKFKFAFQTPFHEGWVKRPSI